MYYEINTAIEDFESQSKEQEISEIQLGLKIIDNVKLPVPNTFIPPAWRLSRETIKALKNLDRVKNRETLHENKIEFYKHLFNLDSDSFGIFRLAIHPPHDPNEALEIK